MTESEVEIAVLVAVHDVMVRADGQAEERSWRATMPACTGAERARRRAARPANGLKAGDIV